MRTNAARATGRKGNGHGRGLTQLREVQDIIRDRRLHEGPFSIEDQVPALAVVARRLYCVTRRKAGQRPSEADLIGRVRFWAHHPMGRGNMPEASLLAIRAAVVAASWVTYATDTAENAGDALKLTHEARTRLGIRTVWSCDKDPKDRKLLALERKRERDRKSARKRRAEKGAKPRVMVGENREWEAQGISRRTWQRRRKACAAAVSSSVSPNVVSLRRKKEEGRRKSDRKGSHSEKSVNTRARPPSALRAAS
jgi:hypothetical protein